MAVILTDTQKAELKRIWLECGGIDRLAGDFVHEMEHFLNNSSKLITDSNKKIEMEESRDYKNVARQCINLLMALEKIPDLDRLNILSFRESRPEYDGRNIPLCDPFVYVTAIKELAEFQSANLKKCAKYQRQIAELTTFIKRFPEIRGISRRIFIDLACVLWGGDNSDNFEKAYRPGKK